MVEKVCSDYNDSEKQFAIDLSSATINISDDEDENKSQLSASAASTTDNSLTLPDSNFPPNTYFNVDKSSGVIIGPVSQFHGHVTIIQNAANNSLPLENDKQSNSIKKSFNNFESTTFSTAQLAETNNQPSQQRTKKCSIKKIILFTFLTLAAIGLILFAIFYSLGVYISNENNKPSNDEQMYENSSQIPNSLHKLIYRDRWGGRKPLYERPQKTPVKYVIISHTAGTFCESISSCSAHMVQMQSQHVSELGSPDIGYNFVIGADDNIYVGRGWDNKNFHMNLETIGISFMGNYVFNTLKPGMIEAAHELLKLGVDKGKLDKDYILVAHNQTFNTISPGPNIYRQIKFWPHFSPEILEDS